MFDIGWTELLVIGVVALVVVGPKDLPVMFKTFGRFMARARSMAREFQRAMENAADEAGIKDVASDIKAATSPVSSGIDKLKQAADRFEKWEPGRPSQPTGPTPPATPSAPTTTAATSTAPTGTEGTGAPYAVPQAEAQIQPQVSPAGAAGTPAGAAGTPLASDPLTSGPDPKAAP